MKIMTSERTWRLCFSSSKLPRYIISYTLWIVLDFCIYLRRFQLTLPTIKSTTGIWTRWVKLELYWQPLFNIQLWVCTRYLLLHLLAGCISVQHSGVWVACVWLHSRGAQVSHVTTGEVQVSLTFKYVSNSCIAIQQQIFISILLTYNYGTLNIFHVPVLFLNT